MGQEGAQSVLRESAVVPDSALQRYVSGLGMSIARTTERPNVPWSFVVLDDPVVNAFALPGGPIFFTRGILTHMTSEAELVSVLGHEIGHVTARHSVRQMTNAQLAQVGLVAGAIVSPRIAQFGDLAQTGLQLLFLRFSRGDELQADELGFKYTLNNNYDVREMASMFRTLDRVSGDEGGRIPEWQSTHPNPDNRVANTENRIAALNRSLSGLRVGREDFLRHIEGLVFGENPRDGFFRNGVFHHPDLRFRIDFPSGWQTQNQTTQVVGVSSRKDAIMVLSLAKNGTPSQQLSQFLGQQGIIPGRTTAQPINGRPAAMGEFVAQTQEGALAGVVAFVSHNGATYRILGYTPSASAATWQSTFRTAILSFREETDASILDVKPNRVRLVQLPRAMTIVEFNDAYPSAIPVTLLAIINGVEETQTIPAATLVKRIVAE
ncbi:MAG: Beta-barrel assembly-enhancing protease [Gemmatimonadaceae bacterium]|nr:Beta-barrel assembly-enhancing protease [Gemmatimonadaceae bacterium]